MFAANKCKFTETILDGAKAKSIKLTKEKVEGHLTQTHNDERQLEQLGKCEK